jgi:hypothetical protein
MPLKPGHFRFLNGHRSFRKGLFLAMQFITHSFSGPETRSTLRGATLS